MPLFSAKEKENVAKKWQQNLAQLFVLSTGSVIAPFPTGNISSQLFVILPSTLSFQSATHTGIHFSLFFPHLNIHLSLVVSPAQFCRKCLLFLTLQYRTALTVSFIYQYFFRWAQFFSSLISNHQEDRHLSPCDVNYIIHLL